MVSRRHARIFVENGCWHIEDLNSRNGTWVVGSQITRSELPPKCEVVLYPDAAPLMVEVESHGSKTVIAR
jgi:pSer/pThr/pTyr-binding forkhead associated (FHA) protein